MYTQHVDTHTHVYNVHACIPNEYMHTCWYTHMNAYLHTGSDLTHTHAHMCSWQGFSNITAEWVDFVFILLL